MYDENTIKPLLVNLMRENANISMVYRMDFGGGMATLGFAEPGKEPKQVECKIIAIEVISRLAREAFEEVHGKSELVSSTIRLEEFQTDDARLFLHPYWKLGICEIAVKKA